MLLNHTHSTQHNHSKIKHKAHFPCQPNILYFGTDIFSILMSQMPVEAVTTKYCILSDEGEKSDIGPPLAGILDGLRKILDYDN